MDSGELVEKIEGHMRALNVPGAAVGIRHGDETFTRGFGVTNVDHPVEVDDSTLSQIGSISKTFVGTLTMRLVETGKLELDELPAQIESQLRDNDIRNALKEAHYFTVAREIQREARVRLGNYSAEEITPLDALKAYLETKKVSEERKKVLMEHGERLIRGDI